MGKQRRKEKHIGYSPPPPPPYPHVLVFRAPEEPMPPIFVFHGIV